ncbi:MAG: PAS domain-containing sensor histidine kinase, partial [Candidatus Eisenbacteria bacterium]
MERTAELQRANQELVREIAERALVEKALERQTCELERSNADLDRFASMASHDLQEPLRSISKFAELLTKRYRGRLDPEADDFLAFINEGASWMRALIEGMLGYSRLGSAKLVVESFACDEALDRALKNLQHAIERSVATVTREP